ncbi:MAG TPA: hypothetical protein VFA20_09685 [Myxococcaceae bacterium]|nr:hypothetical protein [Myxococcaceae bacterium]
MEQFRRTERLQAVGNAVGLQEAHDDGEQIAVQLGERRRQRLLVAAEGSLNALVEALLDQARRPRVRGLEPLALLGYPVAQRAQFRGHLVQRPRPVVDAAQLGLEVGAQHPDERGVAGAFASVKDLVGRVEDRPEELQLGAQDLERQALRLVLLGDEVDHHHLVPLPVPVAAADALFDALRVPRQVVVHDGVAELQVEALGAGLGRDEHPGALLELVHQGQAHGDVRLRGWPLSLGDLVAPLLQRLLGAPRVVRPPKERDLLLADEAALDQPVAEVGLGDERLGEDEQLPGALPGPRTLSHEIERLQQGAELAVVIPQLPSTADESLDPGQLVLQLLGLHRVRGRRRRPRGRGVLNGFGVVVLEVVDDLAGILLVPQPRRVPGELAPEPGRHARQARG